MTRVLILGAGGHAQVVADILLAMRAAGQSVTPVGFLDDNPSLQGQVLLGLPVLGSLSARSHIPHEAVVVAIGNNRVRQSLHNVLAADGEAFFAAVHPRSVVAQAVQIGAGAMIAAGVVVNPGTRIGEGVILNTGCTVDHHNTIGVFAHIAPGAHLAGEVEVGPGVLVGVGAAVTPRRYLGPWAVVGAGAVVVQDVPAHTTVVGVPARPLSPRKGNHE